MSFKSHSIFYNLHIFLLFIFYVFNLSVGEPGPFDLQKPPQCGFPEYMFMNGSPGSCSLGAGPRDWLGLRFDFFGKATGGTSCLVISLLMMLLGSDISSH